MGIRKIIADRPWLLVVVGLALFVTLDIIFLIIATTNAPVPAH